MSSHESNRIDAGPFGEWLTQMRASLRGDGGTVVPCGDCRGCCVSSYYIPIRPQDVGARERIPDQYLIAAAGQPPGHLMMKYREDGTCPMLSQGNCSIYEHRPQTCRDYDCRIFAAAGIAAAGADKPVINRRVSEWRFRYDSEADRRAHAAVTAAATFIRQQREAFPGGRSPTAPTGIAVLAIKVYSLFLDPAIARLKPADVARAIIAESRRFDAGEAQ
ncbi:MAG TPA: YkgJ family cysteine cluster protein [Povalibacter sp.]|uniref:YkgJ family cysteine cluster protein n=1 Tax=Povalibacter sp. TaxID=1962978 RepID=UPI002B6F3327|nr:YkgJ family cysteine cluster protein [Povalibacter sp.]HMN47360.1 YkgJ family cysteine cluster protein [Povalibacter sp.]